MLLSLVQVSAPVRETTEGQGMPNSLGKGESSGILAPFRICRANVPSGWPLIQFAIQTRQIFRNQPVRIAIVVQADRGKVVTIRMKDGKGLLCDRVQHDSWDVALPVRNRKSRNASSGG